MRNKIITSVCMCLMAALLLLFCPADVNAAETESEYQLYSVWFECYTSSSNTLYHYSCQYSTDGSWYLIVVIRDWTSTYGAKSAGFSWYNPTTGEYYDPVNSVLCPDEVILHSYTSSYAYSDGTMSEPQQYPVVMTGGIDFGSLGEVSVIPIFEVDCDTLGDNVGSYFHDMYSSGELTMLAGYDYWNTGNRYNYESMYSSSIVAPEVRYAMTCWDDYSSDYVIDIKFLLPDLDDNSGYFAELWADIPTGYDSNGKVAYTKTLLQMIDVSTILKQNNVNVQNPNGSGWVTENYGSYYEIYGTWTSLIPYISADDSIQYGGVVLYLRSSVPVTDVKTLVSDYVYFVINPGDVEHTDEGWVATNPDIYVGQHDTFNEDGAGLKSDTDVSIPNSSDLEYIGGVSNDPGVISSSGKWKYSFAGNWTVDDLEDWVNSGFGLTGSNGLLGFIGNCFFYLPSEFVSIIMFIVVVVAIVAIIKIVRGM